MPLSNIRLFKLIMSFSVFSISLFLYFYTLENIIGNKILFSFFALTSILLVILGIIQHVSVGFFILSITLWLGIYIKHQLHIALNYNYIEPIGEFLNLPSQWDQVYLISIIGMLGTIIIGSYLLFQSKLNDPIGPLTFLNRK